ncbi:renin receptor-like protein, partial [Dinothrombium tinctorium]
DLNLAYQYDADFHVAFAMIAFTTIVFGLCVFGISIGLWNMDPGRDSIIYRVTNQRIKKDQ